MSAKIIFGTWCALSFGVSARKAPWEPKTDGPRYSVVEDKSRQSQWAGLELTYADEMPPAVGGPTQWLPPSWGGDVANYAAFALPQPASTYSYPQAIPYDQAVYAAPAYDQAAFYSTPTALPSVPMPAPTASYQSYMPPGVPMYDQAAFYSPPTALPSVPMPAPTASYQSYMPPVVGGPTQWLPPSSGVDVANYAAFALPQPAPTYLEHPQAIPYDPAVDAAPTYDQASFYSTPTAYSYPQAIPYDQAVYAAPTHDQAAFYATPTALPSVPMPSPTVSYQSYMPY